MRQRAATHFAELLGPHDRLSVAVFDDEVHTIFGPTPGRRSGQRPGDRARQRRERVTNLSGGWLKGREHVQEALAEGTNRVVLFHRRHGQQGAYKDL